MTPTLSKLITWILALLPGVLGLFFLSPGDVSSPGAVLNLSGRLTGIWGLSFMLVAGMLCCRVPGFDRPFGGLTKLWQLHHRIGSIGFLMVLAHPLLLALGAAEVSLDAAATTLFSTRPAVLWGWTALLVLMVFMGPGFGFFGQIDYQRWKWLHRLSGLSILLALVHTYMLARTLPGGWHEVIWLLLTLAVLGAIGYRWIFSRWLGRQPYRVSRVDHPANNIVELTLEPQGMKLSYEAGQFVYLTPRVPDLAAGNREEHPYTLSSAPDEPVLRIAIKALGDSSHALQQIETDSTMMVEGPYGRFFPVETSREPELWIAGGIGITPFLGRLRHLSRQGKSLDAHLVYCVQDEAREVFGRELEGLVEAIPDCRLSIHYFYREGPIDATFIQRNCPDADSRHVYVCGPEALLRLSRGLLREMGLTDRQITTEEFSLL